MTLAEYVREAIQRGLVGSMLDPGRVMQLSVDALRYCLAYGPIESQIARPACPAGEPTPIGDEPSVITSTTNESIHNGERIKPEETLEAGIELTIHEWEARVKPYFLKMVERENAMLKESLRNYSLDMGGVSAESAESGLDALHDQIQRACFEQPIIVLSG